MFCLYNLFSNLANLFCQLCMARVGEPQEFYAKTAHWKQSEGLAFYPTLVGRLISVHGTVLEEC